MKNSRSEGRMDAKNRGWVAEILATDCEKSVDSHRIGRYYAEMVSLVGINEEEA